MNLEQAIKIIDEVVAGLRGTRQERQTVEMALKTLVDAARKKNKNKEETS